MVNQELDLQHEDHKMLILANTQKEVKKEMEGKQGFFSKIGDLFKRDKKKSDSTRELRSTEKMIRQGSHPQMVQSKSMN